MTHALSAFCKPLLARSRKPAALAAGLVVALALALAACGGGGAQGRAFELAVRNGELTGDDTITVNQGDTVTLNLSTDSAGVFHLHGYDLRARVEAGGRGFIKFVADATGRFEIALHPTETGHDMSAMSDIVIAWIEVQP